MVHPSRSDTGRKPWEADYGQGEHTIDCDELGLLDEDAITERLVQAFESKTYSPPRLPDVANELLALSRDPNVEFGKIKSLLERDAMLAGQILSVAGSTFYNRSGSIVTLQDAVARLGLEKLRGIVMQAAMSLRVFRSQDYSFWMERLRNHSLSTAHIGRIVSRYAKLPEEQVFLGGLLHDIGMAGILLVLGDAKRGQEAPALDVLWPSIHGAHGKAGSRMVKLWGLPEEVEVAVLAHHYVHVDGKGHPLASAVCLAEIVAHDLGLSLVPSRGAAVPERSAAPDSIDRSDAITAERAREALGIPPTALKLIKADALEWAQSLG